MDAITLAGRSPEVTAAGPPRLRGRYRLVELIGRGGEGSVYRARDETLGRDVAVKVFEASATTEKDIRRQEDEVNLLASLSHHSLVTLLDAGVDRTDAARPRVFFVMELVTGADLKVQLERGTLTARQIAHIGYDLAEGLQYIHHRGVVHRDVKPANILLVDYNHGGARYRAKLTDFGIALVGAIDRRDPDAVTTGTAAYLSPEQTRGQTLGSASDIYSLGLVLLECFTRTLAFPGDPIPSALARLRNDPSVPVALVTIVDQDRIWFTSHHGLEIDHIERHPGLCASAILDDVPWVVEDARFDPRTLANPLVASDFGLQFYAGVPLRTRDGHNLGTLCVLDFEPRQASEEELATLRDLAAVVMSEMELRLEGRRSALALESATSTPS
ncbi:hypothetical protein C3B59_01065 [Cryobacterium zongtaii]|uniref:Protein kinase domain-containing protein n=1 Tax=Cryobacterium zongtaii TaxID=1259217 RepID=A0A2S3ZQQ5_9MICO|nr:GAF domain-containing serine/threonine-protein kinase [Cryobacterium zongtaii]POH71227.1 hypothetical protein C3B59_01065 [Cryobacterium zongtaii]